MYIFNWPLLDYIWRILVFGSFVVTISYSMPLVMQLRVFRIGPTELKKIWRFFHGQVLVILGLASVYLIFNQEQVIKCFEVFLKSPDSISLTRWLARFWLGGFVGLIGLDIFRILQTLLTVKKFLPNRDTKLNELVQKMTMEFGLKVAPKVLLQESRQSPFVFGIFHSRIVFPSGFATALEESVLRSVVAHELVHIKDADVSWNLMEHWLRRIFFFNPIVYLSHALYKDIQEKSADQQAIQNLRIKNSEFANGFFRVIEYCQSSRKMALSLSSVAGFKLLKSRMQYLADSTDKPANKKTVLLFLVGLLLSSSWSFVEAKTSILNSLSKTEPNMCVQVQHEIVLEKIFHVEATNPVRCE